MLEDGRYGTIRERGDAERINPSYLSRILRLTLLSPAYVATIVDGTSLRTLDLRSLARLAGAGTLLCDFVHGETRRQSRESVPCVPIEDVSRARHASSKRALDAFQTVPPEKTPVLLLASALRKLALRVRPEALIRGPPKRARSPWLTPGPSGLVSSGSQWEQHLIAAQEGKVPRRVVERIARPACGLEAIPFHVVLKRGGFTLQRRRVKQSLKNARQRSVGRAQSEYRPLHVWASAAFRC